MSFTRGVALLMVAIWCSWMCAGQALLVAGTPLGALAPDASLVLLVMAAGTLPRQEGLGVALVVGLARAAYTIDPPAAVMASVILALAAARGVRRVVDFELPLARSGAAAVAAASVTLWLGLVHAVRQASGGEGGAGQRLGQALLDAPLAALSAGLMALALGPVLLKLPGLTPLKKRRW